MRLHNISVAVATVGLTVTAIGASFASGTSVGHYISPASNTQQSSDAGKFAHTNLLIKSTSGISPDSVPYGETNHTLQTFFGFPSNAGTESIAIVDAYKYPKAQQSFNTYSKYAGLPEQLGDVHNKHNTALTILYQDGVTGPPVDPTGGGWDLEQALDIEVAHAIAPNAHIYLFEADSSSYADLFNCVQQASKVAQEVSMSFSGAEFSGETAYDSTFQTPGVVYFGASGDDGGASGVNYPSCSPYVVGVGGVTLIRTREKSQYVPFAEYGWNGSTGGVSTYEPEPSYQTTYGLSLSGRGVPDISFDADPNTGFGEYVVDAGNYTTGFYFVGGTSLACPAIAAMVNDAGSFMASSTDELSSLYTNSASFYDVTQGDNGYYLTGTGWDAVTGLGTPLGETGL